LEDYSLNKGAWHLGNYVLIESLKQHRVITIIYQGENKNISQRDIRVLKYKKIRLRLIAI